MPDSKFQRHAILTVTVAKNKYLTFLNTLSYNYFKRFTLYFKSKLLLCKT